MLPPSPDPAGSPRPPETDPPASVEEAYWDVDSDIIEDPRLNQAPAPPAAPSPSVPTRIPAPVPVASPTADVAPGGPPAGEADHTEAESADSSRNRPRSLKKSRAEPLPFRAPGSNPEIPAWVNEAPPVSPIELAPRPMRTAQPEKTEKPEGGTGPSRLERKSGEGVEIFTRQAARPLSTLDHLPAGLPDTGRPVLSSGTAGFQPARPQEGAGPAAPPPRRHSSRRAARRRKRALVTLLTLAALTGSVIWIRKSQAPPPPLPDSGPALSGAADSAPGKSALPDPSRLPPLAERQEAVRLGVLSLLKTPDWEAKLPHILHPERFSGRMKDFYLAQKGQDPEFTDISVGPPVEWQDAWWFVVSLGTGEDPPVRVAARETPDGPLFDWENLVGYGTIPFTAFHGEKPTIPHRLPLRVRTSNVYEGGYSSQDYKAFDISPRSGQPVLHAYAPNGSLAVRQLADVAPSSGWSHAILTVRWESSSESAATVVIDQAQAPALPGTPSLLTGGSLEKSEETSNKSDAPAVKTPDSGKDKP